MKFGSWSTLIALLAFPAVARQATAADCASVLVPAGTEIPLMLTQAINPRTAKAGDPISFVLTDDFSWVGCVVAARGTTSTATIAALARPRSFGRAGKVELRFTSIQAVDGQRLWLDQNADKNDSQPAASSARGIALPITPIRFALHGSHATVPRGTLASVTMARSAQVRGRPVSDSAPPADPGAPATVIIFQSPEELVPGQEHLYSGGVFLSCFEQGRYFKGELKAGNYRIDKSKVPLQLHPETIKYLRIYNEEAGAIEEATSGEFEFFAPELRPLGNKCTRSILRHAFRPIKPKSKK